MLILDPPKNISYTDDMSNITTMGISPDQERSRRMLSYSMAMGIRLVCIGLCFITPGWLVTLPILGACIIPWLAVVAANTVASNTVASNKNSAGELESPYISISS